MNTDFNNVCIVGIKGVAMAHIAIILKKMGCHVSGWDVSEEFITDDELKKNSIEVYHDQNLPQDVDLVIYSAAHGGSSNPIVQEAQSRNIKVMHQAAFLGLLLKQFRHTLAVCGSHGKTTTSSLLAFALLQLKKSPSYLVGSSSFNQLPGGDFKDKEYFVIEADEYAVDPPSDNTAKLLHLQPESILCTNIDFDHPDVYKSVDQIEDVFRAFFKKSKNLFVCGDDDVLVEIAKETSSSYQTFGYSDECTLRIVNHETTSSGSTFDLLFKEQLIEGVRLKIYGEKNISNAAGVFLTLLHYGFNPDEIKQAIKEFTGPRRRFEEVYTNGQSYVFDDYAHHPEEIKAVLHAARDRFPKKRIIVMFQPHTFSRTKSLLENFADAFTDSTIAYIAPIFSSARENASQFSITSKDIQQRAHEKGNDNVLAFDTTAQMMAQFTHNFQPGDVVFTMGAGDIYKLKNDIINTIK